jgi:hypothetical protein
MLYAHAHTHWRTRAHIHTAPCTHIVAAGQAYIDGRACTEDAHTKHMPATATVNDAFSDLLVDLFM